MVKINSGTEDDNSIHIRGARNIILKMLIFPYREINL